jgi:hypothetical protein
MTSTVQAGTRKQPSAAARRTGYVFAILINAALLFAVNVWPEWDVVPFLSDEFTQVLALVNASMVVTLLVNVVYLFNDRRPVKQLLDIVSLAVTVVVGIRMWQVFPFDFGDQTFDWELLFRIAIVLGIVGVAIAIIVNIVSLSTDTRSRS